MIHKSVFIRTDETVFDPKYPSTHACHLCEEPGEYRLRSFRRKVGYGTERFCLQCVTEIQGAPIVNASAAPAYALPLELIVDAEFVDEPVPPVADDKIFE